MLDKKYKLIAFSIPLGLAALACGLTPGAVAEPGPTPTVPVLVPTVTSPAAQPPDSPPTSEPGGEEPVPEPEGGFLGGQVLDAATLPVLPILPAGLGPLFCEGQFEEPAIDVRNVTNEQMQLCLYNFPTEASSPDITITLTHPDGTVYTETFVYVSDGLSVSVEGLSGGTSGSMPVGDFVPPGPPSIGITLFTPASFPSSGWTATASTADGSINVPPTPLTLGRFGLQVGVVDDPASANLFVLPTQTFSAPNTLSVFGLGYGPNTQVTVAFYREDETLGQSPLGMAQLRPEYATFVMTDAEGNFDVEFAVGAATVQGDYFTVAEPIISAETLTNPFAGRFSIQ